MEFTITINSADDPDAVGELLRGRFFNTPHDGVGCYSHFDWAESVEGLPSEPVECDPLYDDGDGLAWTRGIMDGIECRWYWDGDGTLEFVFPDGSFLSNDDCKKDHFWKHCLGDDSEGASREIQNLN